MEEHTYVRSAVVRTHDVITKPKFLALMGLPISLSYGVPRARAELRYYHYSVMFRVEFARETKYGKMSAQTKKQYYNLYT